MRTATALLVTVAMAAAALEARDAAACGGCFVGETEVTQITGEEMLLSLSDQQTTLYDQITYSGSPSSFAWVLPIKGLATVGLSSDALFKNLDADTAVTINSPAPPVCPGNGCGGFGFSSGASGTGGASGGGPVTVIAQQVVGPYETVQLASTDPNALSTWLTAHGYNISAADAPVIAAYVSEGFNFLALKLVPGAGVSSMQPVRVTTQGASPTLPLRMVAVGTGALTPITLWVLAEGRYDTVNLPSFQIDQTQLVWDWDTQSSNYASLKQAGFAKTNNTGWVVEDAEPFSMYTLQSQLSYLVDSDPADSGYDDPTGMTTASQNLADDMSTLFASIPPGSVWVTRFEGVLSRAALGADLQIAAASDQSQVSRYLQATQQTGTPPACPVVTPCSSGEGGSGGSSGGTGGDTVIHAGACAVNDADGSGGGLFGGAALALAFAVSRRRSARRR